MTVGIRGIHAAVRADPCACKPRSHQLHCLGPENEKEQGNRNHRHHEAAWVPRPAHDNEDVQWQPQVVNANALPERLINAHEKE